MIGIVIMQRYINFLWLSLLYFLYRRNFLCSLVNFGVGNSGICHTTS